MFFSDHISAVALMESAASANLVALPAPPMMLAMYVFASERVNFSPSSGVPDEDRRHHLLKGQVQDGIFEVFQIARASTLCCRLISW